MSNSGAYLNEHFGGRKFAKKVKNPFESEYDPLMDSSAELGRILLNYYQTQIGVLVLSLQVLHSEITWQSA